MKIKIELYRDKESSVLEVEKGITLKEILKDNNPSVFNKFAGAEKEGNFVDFHTPINESWTLEGLSITTLKPPEHAGSPQTSLSLWTVQN